MLRAMSRFRVVTALLLSPLLLASPGCKTSAGDDGDVKDPGDGGDARPAMKLSSSDPIGQEVIAQIDPSVDPCVDFYEFACGSWIAKNPLPDDYPRWGRASELVDRNNEVLRSVLESDAE